MSEDEAVAQFHTAEQRSAAARLGMWLFLGSELLLFAGLLALYGAARAAHPAGFRAGVHHMAQELGAINTFVLLTSSFTVALGVQALEQGRQRSAFRLVFITVLLGAAFLGIKSLEYAEHLQEGLTPAGRSGYAGEPDGFALFVTMYYLMTGLHALHVIAGSAVLLVMALLLRRKARPPLTASTLELGALYWHLVDVIWVFLWPLFYLTGGSS